MMMLVDTLATGEKLVGELGTLTRDSVRHTYSLVRTTLFPYSFWLAVYSTVKLKMKGKTVFFTYESLNRTQVCSNVAYVCEKLAIFAASYEAAFSPSRSLVCIENMPARDEVKPSLPRTTECCKKEDRHYHHHPSRHRERVKGNSKRAYTYTDEQPSITISATFIICNPPHTSTLPVPPTPQSSLFSKIRSSFWISLHA